MHRIAGRCRGPPAMENIKQTCLQPAPLGKPAGRRNQHQSARSQHSVITLIRQGACRKFEIESNQRQRTQPRTRKTTKGRGDRQRQRRQHKARKTTEGRGDSQRQRTQPKARETAKGRGDNTEVNRQGYRQTTHCAQGVAALKASKRSRRRSAQGVDALKASKRARRRSAQRVEALKALKRSRRRSAQGVEALKALRR